MRSTSGLTGNAVSSSRIEAFEPTATRMGSGLLIAAILHSSLLAVAYLRPMPPPKLRSQPIVMEVLTKPKPPEPKPEEPKPAIEPPATESKPQPQNRPLPRELLPVARKDEPNDPRSSAIVVPSQPPGAAERGPGTMPKGPIDLFPKSLGTVVGERAPGAPIPKGPDRLFHDDRLDEKKEPPFELIPEKGGGYRAESRNFTAHIKPDGSLSFDDRFPIGFQKGGTFTFDLTDLAMRGKKQDPYAAEKRRFKEFSEKLRDELRQKALKESEERSMTTLGEQLRDIWSSGRSSAAKRREIYDKWADIADDKEDRMARKGRRMIEEFIQDHLPQGTADGYTADELAHIASERHGLAAFDPYSNP